MEILYEHIINRQNAHIEKLTDLVQQLVSRPPADQLAVSNSGNITNTTNNITINQKISVNTFGNEDKRHITREMIRELMEKYRAFNPFDAAIQIIVKTAFMIYSDPAHPENITCFLPNKKTSDAIVHVAREDGTAHWEIQPVVMAITPMVQSTLDVVFDKQPMEDAEQFANVMKTLRDNEDRFAKGEHLKPILVRNRELLDRMLDGKGIKPTAQLSIKMLDDHTTALDPPPKPPSFGSQLVLGKDYFLIEDVCAENYQAANRVNDGKQEIEE